jgi:magnesium chelatase family protein
MTFEESVETTKVYSIADMLNKDTPLIVTRPFRSPHHTVSSFGLAGGGSIPKPGEISLAHNGLLFLDELPEFDRNTLEILRQPLEDSEVSISRASGRIVYPASFMLVAAMNPCPCGMYGHPVKKCICNEKIVAKYLSKISGPLLDRIDLHVEVMPLAYSELASEASEESSESIRKRVKLAREIQLQRFKGTDIRSNARITPNKLQAFCKLQPEAETLIAKAFEKLGLSARAYDRILKVARTIADLDSSEIIKKQHISQAIQYRSLDKKYWQLNAS